MLCGDELKHIDWRAYARFDRYFVRRYEEEANLDVHLVVDSSGSMRYRGGARGAGPGGRLRGGRRAPGGRRADALRGRLQRALTDATLARIEADARRLDD